MAQTNREHLDVNWNNDNNNVDPPFLSKSDYHTKYGNLI